MKNIVEVKSVLAYGDETTREAFIIKLNQALCYGNTLPHVLLNPNQIRVNGIKVEDTKRKY